MSVYIFSISLRLIFFPPLGKKKQTPHIQTRSYTHSLTCTAFRFSLALLSIEIASMFQSASWFFLYFNLTVDPLLSLIHLISMSFIILCWFLLRNERFSLIVSLPTHLLALRLPLHNTMGYTLLSADVNIAAMFLFIFLCLITCSKIIITLSFLGYALNGIMLVDAVVAKTARMFYIIYLCISVCENVWLRKMVQSNEMKIGTKHKNSI